MRRPRARSASIALSTVALVAACAGDPPSAPHTGQRPLASRSGSDDGVTLCHTPRQGAELIRVGLPARAAHERHGDYVARVAVDPASDEAGDGIHFTRIGDAIAAVRAIRVAHEERTRGACRITIDVAAGIHRGSVAGDAAPERLPLVIDVPDVTLRGALVMTLDADGRATGVGASGDATTLVASPALTTALMFSQPMIVINAHPDGGYAGHGAVIEGFSFASGRTAEETTTGGQAIFALRVNDVAVQGNRFGHGFSESIDMHASEARIERNHLSGAGGNCDICLAGPGAYHAIANRLVVGGIPGIFVTPTTKVFPPAGVEAYDQPAAATVEAWLVNNEIRDHRRQPVGTGIRVGTLGNGTPDVEGLAIVAIERNRLENNTFGIIVDAAFPVAATRLRGDARVTLRSNQLVRSCQRDLLVAFSRHTTALRLGTLPYLRNSTLTIDTGAEIDGDGIWYGHEPGLGNTFLLDGERVDPGNNTAYDAAKVCSG